MLNIPSTLDLENIFNYNKLKQKKHDLYICALNPGKGTEKRAVRQPGFHSGNPHRRMFFSRGFSSFVASPVDLCAPIFLCVAP
jgi:hypothetical protein